MTSSVSILLPTYEPRPQHLRAALDSLLAQTVGDWTALIHDDASGTDVRSIVEPYLSDPRFTFARSDRRLGIGGNWNACLRRALGEQPGSPYAQFLFQDDAWKSTYLERCVAVLDREPAVGFVAVNHAYAIEDGAGHGAAALYAEVTDAREALQPGRHPREEFLRAWLERGLRPNLVGEPSFVMLRRSLAEEVGLFNASMKQGLDFEYWIRCLLRDDVAWIPEELGIFRVHSGGASAKNRRAWTGFGDRWRCFGLLLRELPPGELREAARRSRVRYLLTSIKRVLR